MSQYAQRLFITESRERTMKTLNWTSRDLELLPDDGNRYEIIDGELYVAKQPDWQHQLVGFRLGFLLQMWNEQSQAGLVNLTPGIIFADDTNVVPDVVWISQQLRRSAGTSIFTRLRKPITSSVIIVKRCVSTCLISMSIGSATSKRFAPTSLKRLSIPIRSRERCGAVLPGIERGVGLDKWPSPIRRVNWPPSLARPRSCGERLIRSSRPVGQIDWRTIFPSSPVCSC